MKNKNIFKEMYNEKINKENNYQEIIRKIEKKDNRFKYLKLSIIPVCLIILCSFIVINSNSSFLEEKRENKEVIETMKETININNMSNQKGLLKIDGNIKEANNVFIPYYDVLSNLNVPSYLEEKDYAIYVKSNPDINNYDKVIQYVKSFYNDDKSIEINYSQENEPVRDYLFQDGEVSVINNFKLVIYKYENSYMTKFKYKDLFIDIETTNITEEQFLNLIKSIIK